MEAGGLPRQTQVRSLVDVASLGQVPSEPNEDEGTLMKYLQQAVEDIAGCQGRSFLSL